MSSPVALVTGTSSGIGRSTALRLAARGVTVVATVRREPEALEREARAAGRPLDVRLLDVTDLDACRALVDDVVADHGRLDLLVNNAGRGQVGTLEQVSDDDLQAALDTNLRSVAALTRAALPHLRATRGRVVTVTSVGGVVGQPFNDAYCAAKFAVEGLMQSLAPVVERDGVGVHVVEPGPVATSFVDNVGRPAGDDRYAPLLDAYLARSEAVFALAQSPDDVADVVVTACLDADQPFRLQTSEQARGFAGLSLADLDGARVLTATRGFIEQG